MGSGAPLQPRPQQQTLFGHPVGLFVLFFAEMWERFSYYGMRALLLFYMLKGFLGMGDERAYAVYGAYTALVYATPFLGGLLADRLLGARRAVVWGGLFMAAGHALMTVERAWAFYGALALLVCGNGFFKPNISTIVGQLYAQRDPRRDGGYTLFYMGINLGAALAPLLCGYIGETYGWHYGFGLATIGMLVGVAVFVAPVRVTQALILVGALATGTSLLFLHNNVYQLAVNAFVALALAAAAVISSLALGRGGLPADAGGPPAPVRRRPLALLLTGVALALPLVAFFVQRSAIAGGVLALFGGAALVYLLVEAFRCERVERERLFAALALMFFAMLFWAFFEQAGSSINNFTDRNVDRAFGGAEVPASAFQATNPIFILLFGVVFSALWSWLAARRAEPSTPNKFALGLLQLGLGFGALWLGARSADERGLVNVSWLLLGYLLHTTGELCVSPVGLSMVTRLSPPRIVSTVMGAWFMATAFSQYLAGLIAQLTGVRAAEGGTQLPPPSETVALYGSVFGGIAATALVSALACFALAPLLARWMHPEVRET
jgi:proton-dependent oligopeptide transporter, POT family